MSATASGGARQPASSFQPLWHLFELMLTPAAGADLMSRISCSQRAGQSCQQSVWKGSFTPMISLNSPGLSVPQTP